MGQQLSFLNQNLTYKGAFQLQTLMDSYGDKAFDKFTAWTLRNGFDFPKDLEVALVSDYYTASG